MIWIGFCQLWYLLIHLLWDEINLIPFEMHFSRTVNLLIALVKLSDCRVERSQTLFRWSFDVIIARINYQYSTRYGRPFRNVFIPYGHPERWCGHWTQYWIQATETSFCAAEATGVTKYLLPRLLYTLALSCLELRSLGLMPHRPNLWHSQNRRSATDYSFKKCNSFQPNVSSH